MRFRLALLFVIRAMGWPWPLADFARTELVPAPRATVIAKRDPTSNSAATSNTLTACDRLLMGLPSCAPQGRLIRQRYAAACNAVKLWPIKLTGLRARPTGKLRHVVSLSTRGTI